jgi:DNA-binding CsgD family transcriptional regulator
MPSSPSPLRLAQPNCKKTKELEPQAHASRPGREATASPPAVVLLDRAGTLIHVSPAAQTILTYLSGPPGAPRNCTTQDRLGYLLGPLSAAEGSPALGWVLSGRRRYLCWVYRCPPGTCASNLAAIVCFERPIHMPLLIAAARRAFRLSNRESQILSLALLGLSNKEIAGRLRISANTVKTYVRSLLAKLDVSTRSGLLWRLLDTRPALAPA